MMFNLMCGNKLYIECKINSLPSMYNIFFIDLKDRENSYMEQLISSRKHAVTFIKFFKYN